MRIVQTFWTAGRDPLKYSFGWAHPEYNLMSWTLSCLSLREHYDEVALYTDQEGYDVLINKLHLPYTEVNVVYDKNLCLPQHWAYAKIKTYSMQTKPFLHVDGDVYLPHPIPEDIVNAPLVAQNKEICTSYYGRMLHRIFSKTDISVSPYIKQMLSTGDWYSYNMGVFGGNELEIIENYCKEVFYFVEANKLNNLQTPQSKTICNVFFEQMLFGLFAKYNNVKVKCLIPGFIRDNGYDSIMFCNFSLNSDCGIIHMIGKHKHNIEKCNMMMEKVHHKYSFFYELVKYALRNRITII